MFKKESNIQYKYFFYLLLLLLISIPLFANLGTLPIRLWDESRLAINSYEMLHNKNYFIPYYNGIPDMWNTKPPFLIWLQVISMKLWGVNELAVRLPSVLAALGTCFVLLYLSKRQFTNYLFGFIAVFVLICSSGYMDVHASRTGDYDALLTLFTTCSGLFFFFYCEKKRPKDIYLFFLFTTLAVLTKSIAGLLFLPSFLIYSILNKQLIPILKDKHLYIGLFIFAGIVLFYYLMRESHNPGYISAVIKNEFGGRYFKVIERHDYGYLYYARTLIKERFTYWVLFLPLGLLVGLTGKNAGIKRITSFSFLMVFTYFLVITLAKTKLEWYDVPMYPFLSILVTVFIYHLINVLNYNRWLLRTLKNNIASYLLIILIFAFPYQQILAKTLHPTENPEDKTFYKIEYYLRDALNGKKNVQGEYVVYAGYNANILFYIRLLQDNGVKVNFKSRTKLDDGDLIIVSQNYMKHFIEKNYSFETIKTEGNIVFYKILAKNEQR